jgi:anaerobic ribonucleoside-triphosphate reductase activating protein
MNWVATQPMPHHIDPASTPACPPPPQGSKGLQVGGFTPFSATDYPGQLAAVVFVQGCPWACGYCHNPHLQPRLAHSPLAWTDVMARLRRRVGLLDAVVFSGGEPTMDPALADAMRDVRQLGFAVGLHTAGMYPRRLAEVLPLVDWVGLDIKALATGYDRITATPGSAEGVWHSLRAVLDSGVACECRTTVHPGLHSAQDILALAAQLRELGVPHYAVQSFRATGCASATLQATATASPLLDSSQLATLASGFERFVWRNG